MTAGPIEDVRVRMPRGRGSTWTDRQDIPDGHRHEVMDGTPAIVRHEPAGRVRREVGTVRAGETVRADRPLPVELRPAELVGPRRRS